MGQKIKILAIGDLVTPTGFSRVLTNILTNLPKEYYEIVGLGVNHFGDPHNLPFKVYPALTPATIQIGDVYGINRIPDIVNKEHPDIIFLLNDIWVLTNYFRLFKEMFTNGRPKIVAYFPIDARDHAPRWYDHVDVVDRLVTYTKFAKDVATLACPNREFEIIPHGVDTKTFYKINNMSKKEIKATLFPTKPEFYDDSFIVLNANRNQPRKKLWITMEAFKLFSEGKPENVRLYMHSGIQDQDINTAEFAIRLGIDNRLHVSSLNNGPQTVPDEKLNRIYNSCEVGVNTSMGEGWGLTTCEHGVTGAPQIVPANSANIELYSDCGLLVPSTMDEIFKDIMTRGTLVRPEDVAEQMQVLYTNKDLYNDLSKKTVAKFLSPEYEWSNIALLWDKLFKEEFGRV